MNKLLLGIFSFSTLFCMASVEAASKPQSVVEQESRALNWTTDYSQALVQAKDAKKPLFILFTGSDWCSWCQRFEKEVISDRSFGQEVADSYVFVKLDFTLNLKDDPERFKEYQEIKAKYGAKGFPSVVIATAEEEIMGVTGYQEGGGATYARHLASLIEEYELFAEKMEQNALARVDVDELQRLYEKATLLQREQDQESILSEGLKRDKEFFFATEKYRLLLENGGFQSEEAEALKAQILASSTEKLVDNARFLAVLDFQQNLQSDDLSLGDALTPLHDYLQEFGERDREHRWRIQMLISQYFSDHNEFQRALEFAELAKDSAPKEVQEDITEAVRFLEMESEVR